MIEYRNEIPKIDEYFPLFESTGWNSTYKMAPAQIERAISHSSFAVSAYDSGRIVGFARAVSDHVLYATIYDVVVYPEYQKAGIGAALVENIVAQCKAAGVFTVHLFAADGTEPFYNKLGFQARPANMPGMRYEHT